MNRPDVIQTVTSRLSQEFAALPDGIVRRCVEAATPQALRSVHEDRIEWAARRDLDGLADAVTRSRVVPAGTE